MAFPYDELYPVIYSSDENRASSEESRNTDEGSLDALMRDYDGYGTTPPRTRIHYKQMKKKTSVCKVVKGIRRRSPALDHHLSNIDSEEDGFESKRKSDKRSIHLLRNSERTLKLNVEDMSTSKDETFNCPSTYKVESASRFLSLNCKLVKAAKYWKCSSTESSKDRSNFHGYLENMVKAGSAETKSFKSQVSHENLWQTELKDMIWLELQAWIADRTVTQQDKYLCDARQAVPQLIDDILNYRFEKKQDRLSTLSNDSGVDFPAQENGETCDGCLCLFCPTCMEYEVMALQEVGNLLSRLEAAEALFPSNKSFGNLFPRYNSSEFRRRVKAMCLWFNMTRQLRLKTIIIGKQLMLYARGSYLSTSINSTLGTPDSIYDVEWNYSDSSYIQPLQNLGKLFIKTEDGDTSAYRKFIEDVLKSKGLKKSFQFMEHLHSQLLRKGRIALEKPNPENNNNYNSLDENQLRKYGYWSEEYQSLNLPSFRSAFLFLSRIPLDVIHEFLRLRLETKLDKPSSLSIRQLMKELKEGLKFAVINKERYLYHCEVALVEFDEEYKSKFRDLIKTFDSTVQEIIQLYLSYLEQWVSITQFGKLQKNVLEEEWKFITYTAPHFPGCDAMSVKVFCKISCDVFIIICNYLKEKIALLLNEYSTEAEEEDLPPSATIFCSSNLPHRKMLQLCRGLQTLFIESRERTIHIVTLMKVLVKHCGGDKNNIDQSECPIESLKEEALKLCELMKQEIVLIESIIPEHTFEDHENFALQTRIREVIHQMYRCTFEYYKEIGKIITVKRNLIYDMYQLAVNWLNFVKNYCEKGRGMRPRWANFGIEFILFISNPKFTKHLFDEEFSEFRTAIECGLEYIQGCAQPSPTLPTSGHHASPQSYYRYSISSSEANQVSHEDKVDFSSGDVNNKFKLNREERMLAAVKALDERMESKLKEEELIGTVISCSNSNNYDKKFIKPRSVTFVWQRGIKIGQGRFGKVYTAVNNDTGELMAMKEISLSPNDVRTIKSVATELKIFEGIKHENLVRYYGAEIHRDELLIFMELCPEGTLEGLIMASENGLPESIVRRYTKQLILAVATLHEHSIVHRDIKPANIFLASEGNTLKLGDFGSAVKIRAHTTAPGELKGFVGTQAYMAPEVFMKTNTVGHGRAADIWSLGCVVIEMASGKRPWAEYDSNYQIMFKVGMGETPEIPDSLSDEGKNFVKICIQHNPKRRAAIKTLLQDNFLKVESEEEGVLCTMPSELEEYLKLGIKR